MELIDSLNKKFKEVFSKDLAELNKSMYPAAKLDNGNYEAPVITLGLGGGTVVKEAGQELNPPTSLKVELKEVESFEIVYRIAISRSETEIADKNPAYFTYLFKTVLSKALMNYSITVGKAENIRFGSHYAKAELLNIGDGADNIELRLEGSWANV